MTKRFDDLDFTVVARMKDGDVHVSFEVFESDSFVEASSKPYLHGYVKWDGCSNWYFDEQDRCMLHACSRSGLARFSEVMCRCYDLAREILGEVFNDGSA